MEDAKVSAGCEREMDKDTKVSAAWLIARTNAEKERQQREKEEAIQQEKRKERETLKRHLKEVLGDPKRTLPITLYNVHIHERELRKVLDEVLPEIVDDPAMLSVKITWFGRMDYHVTVSEREEEKKPCQIM
jgi:hypothetical protein